MQRLLPIRRGKCGSPKKINTLTFVHKSIEAILTEERRSRKSYRYYKVTTPVTWEYPV